MANLNLTAAMRRCLVSVANGTVHRVFDVYGGYRWTESEHSTGWRKFEHNAPSPILRLIDHGLIEIGPTERPYSGRHIAAYRLTEAGRAALQRIKGD